MMNEQEKFWAQDYAQDYIDKNNCFDQALALEAWNTMLSKSEGVESILECGCNIGRNIASLQEIYPEAGKSIIEISKPAYDYVTSKYSIKKSFNGSIVDSNISGGYDIVFTMGVLIHISPDDLLVNMKKIFSYSKKYILIGEYFNRTPVQLDYQGEKEKLFKMDFGKFFMENFSVSLVDYGFLWGKIYDPAGFDDITWWLFEK